MKQWKRFWICGVALMLTFLLIPRLSAAASDGWTVLGDAEETSEGTVLTESVRSRDGAYAKVTPISTTNGFTLSFDYLITSGGAAMYNWIEIPFSDQPFESAMFPAGYTLCYGIMIGGDADEVYSTSAYSEEHYRKTTLPSGVAGKAAHADNAWHSVVIRYADSAVQVYDSDELVVSCSYFPLPDMIYTGFAASTARALGTQRHVVRNVRIEGAEDACLLHLNAQGGNCDTDTAYALRSGACSLPEATKDGYTFAGWYAEPSCVTRVDTGRYSFYPGQTVYAGWKPVSCVIKFDPKGGSVGVSSKTVYYGEPYGSLPVPKKEGYDFCGWYTDKVKGEVTSATKVSTVVWHTLRATWKLHVCRVRFNAGKGSVSEKTRMTEHGTALGKLPTPKRRKYTFLGWYTRKKGGKKITSGKIIKQDCTFYAHWAKSKKKIKIKLKANGGSCAKSSLTVTYGGKLKGLPKPTRRGYTFVGWFTAKKDGQKVTKSTKVVKVLPKKTLYALWKKKSPASSGGSSSGGSSSGGSSGRNRFVPDCVFCHGSGRCSTCGGDGYRWSYALDSERLTCYKCTGSGRCSVCGGSGKRY